DVIEMQDRKEPWIGAPPLEMVAKVHAFEFGAQQRRRQAAHPFVEIAEDNLRSVYMPVGYDRRHPARLMAALENRRPKMDVVDVQHAASRNADVDALHVPLPAVLPRQIVLYVSVDRQPAKDDIAKLVTADVARRRHHPAHAESGANLLDVTVAVRAGANDF